MSEITARRVILTSLSINVIDIVTNLIIAVVTGSIVMAAETIQGFADLLSTFFIYVGFKKSEKAANSQYPLGRGRELYFWTLIASLFMLGFTATISFYLGFQRFLHPQQVDNLTLAYAILVLSILTNGYALSLDTRRLSSTFSGRWNFKNFLQSEHIETKTTFVLDLMGTSIAICGLISLIFLKFTGDLRFDGIGAMSMGVLLAILSFVLILGSKELLIGRAGTRKIHGQIRESVEREYGVYKITELKTVYVGSGRLLVLLDIRFKNNLSTDQIEKLTLKIKDNLKKDVPSVHEVQIELS